jgi:hypothetical protein
MFYKFNLLKNCLSYAILIIILYILSKYNTGTCISDNEDQFSTLSFALIVHILLYTIWYGT